MSFDKSKVGGELVIPVSFPHLYKQEDGEPVQFVFHLRLETEADVEAIERADASGKRTAHQRNLDRLSRLTTAPPEGFGDFPNSKPVGECVKDYFAEEKMSHFVRGAMNLYNRYVTPEELFRSI